MKAKKAHIKAFVDTLTFTIIRELNYHEMTHIYPFYQKAKKKSNNHAVQLHKAIRKYRRSGARQDAHAEFFDADGGTSLYDDAIRNCIDANPELVKELGGAGVEKAVFAVHKKLYDETYFEAISDTMLLDMPAAGEPWPEQ